MQARAIFVRTILSLTTVVLLVVAPDGPAAAQDGPAIGEPAPDFELTDTHGATHDLGDYRGSWVVLEWLNYGCPYTRKHYRTGNIPSQQAKWTERGVVWLSIVSSVAGAQGHHDPEAMNEASARWKNSATALLLDAGTEVARLYQARTTPHLFVIDPEGTVAYMGAIDDVPTSRDEDLEGATQLVDLALTRATAGEPISPPVSRPYGCTIKYQ